MAKRSSKTTSPSLAVPDDKWRVRDALSTLTRAEEIKADKSLMRDVKREAKQQAKLVGRVAGSNGTSKRKPDDGR